jgi:hypothetical protein
MQATEVIATLQSRGWKRIAVSASSVLARIDGACVLLRFHGEMMFDPVEEEHVPCTSIVVLIDGVERGRVERWPLLPDEELSTLDEVARLAESVVRIGDDDEVAEEEQRYEQ